MSQGRIVWRYDRIATCAVLTFAFIMAACQGAQSVVSEPSVSPPAQQVKTQSKMMVLPFTDLGSIYGIDTNIRNPITGRQYLTGPVPNQIPDYLTSKLITVLQRRADIDVVTSSQTIDYPSLKAGQISLAELRQHVNQIAAGAGADKVMLGHVYRFRQRVGTSMSVESAASVAYDVILFDVSSGRIMWQDHLDETQKSLSENFTQLGKFFRRGASWMTAEELASENIAYQIQSMPTKLVLR